METKLLNMTAPIVVLNLVDGSQTVGWLIARCEDRLKMRVSSFHDGNTYYDGQWYDEEEISHVYLIENNGRCTSGS